MQNCEIKNIPEIKPKKLLLLDLISTSLLKLAPEDENIIEKSLKLTEMFYDFMSVKEEIQKLRTEVLSLFDKIEEGKNV